MSILTSLQKKFLTAFFASPLGGEFFLSGGTALAAFYLRHRRSQDLDLFTLNQKLDFDFVNAEIKKNEIWVDSLENIAIGKLLAIFGRTDAKDFIDFYFLIKGKKLKFEKIFKEAKKKDLGLNEFYFANMLAEVEKLEYFPKTIKSFKKKELKTFFNQLSKELFLKIKPNE